MKRYTLIALILLLSIAATITDDRLSTTITVTNGSTAALTNAQVQFPLSTQALVDSAQIDADLLNLEMHQADGDDIAWMPAPAITAFEGAHLDDGGAFTDETTDINDVGVGDVSLLPVAPAVPPVVNDAFYFCAHHPFRIIRLDISQAGAATTLWQLAWEYYNGTSYTAVSNIDDPTNAFSVAGVSTISWDIPTDMAEDNVNSTAGYCVRARVTDAGASPTTAPLATQGWYDTGIAYQFQDSLAVNASDSNTMFAGFTDQGRESYLSFDATNDIVVVSDDATITDHWDGGGSLEAWIYPKSSGQASVGTISIKSYTIRVQDQSATGVNFRFSIPWSGDDGVWITSGSPITLNEWNHIAITYDADDTGNDPVFYHNGSSITVSEITEPGGTRTTNAGADLSFGNQTPAMNVTFDGFIDDVRLWSDIRTPTEINDNQSVELDGTEAGLVVNLQFDDEYDLNANDETANNNDGTITGAKWESDYKKQHFYAPGDAGAYFADNATSEIGADFFIDVRGQVNNTPGRENYLSLDDPALSKTTSASVNYGSGATIDNIFDGGGTVEFWAKPSFTSTPIFAIEAVEKTAWAVNISSSSLSFDYNFTGFPDPSWSVSPSPTFTNDDWLHVAITYDNGSTANDPTIYINGISQSISESFAPSGTRDSDAANDLIGNLNFTSLTQQIGVDDLRVWSDIRTATEIVNYRDSELIGTEAGLQAYWPMNEGTGTSLTDSTGNGNTGTITDVGWLSDANNTDDKIIAYKHGSAGIVAPKFTDGIEAYIWNGAGSTTDQQDVDGTTSTAIASELGCTASTHEVCVNDGADATYVFTTADTFQRDIYTLGDSWLAPNAAILGVDYSARALESAGTGEIRVGGRLGQDIDLSGTTSITGVATTYTESSTARPDGWPWMPSDLDDLEIIVDAQNTGAGAEETRVSQVFVTVTYELPDVTLTAQDISPGDLALRLDDQGSGGAELRLLVDNHVSDTAADVAEADTALAWQMGGNQGLIFQRHFRLTNGTTSTELGHYETNSFEDGVTLLDRGTASANAVPSFPPLIDDLSGNVGSFIPSTIVSGSSEAVAPNVVDTLNAAPAFAATPVGQPTTPITTPVTNLSNIAGIPPIMFWGLLGLMTTIGVMIFAWRFIPHPGFVMILAGFTLGAFVAMTIFPWWIMFVYAILGLAVLVYFGRGASVGV